MMLSMMVWHISGALSPASSLARGFICLYSDDTFEEISPDSEIIMKINKNPTFISGHCTEDRS